MDKKKKKYISFEELYMDKYKLVYVFIRDYMGSDKWKAEIAEEISQIVWTKVALNIKVILTFDEYHITNYLRRMTQNIATDFFDDLVKEENKKVKMQGKCDETAFATKTTENIYMYKDELDILKICVQTLKKEERELLYMRFALNYSAKEISMIMGISEINVRVRQKRIVEKLRKEFYGYIGGNNGR